MLVDYDEPIETSTGGRAELLCKALTREGVPLYQVLIFEPFEPGYHKPSPGGKAWMYTSEGFWNNGSGREIRIVNSARPNDNVPEEW